MKAISPIRKLLISLFIVFGLLNVDVMAMFINLDEAEVIGQSNCLYYGRPFVCVAVKNEGKTYVVLLDRKGEYAIYEVQGDKAILIWSRDTV